MGFGPVRSALVWDVFAVSTYFTVSLIFWYMGMIPTWRRCATAPRPPGPGRLRRAGHGLARLRPALAPLRDGLPPPGRLATPLVVSVHSVVSADFAMSIVPGWHETVFPPYFVAGAIFSGFAMVWRCASPFAVTTTRGFHHGDHLNVMAKVLLATGMCTSYGYFSEQFMAWYGGNIIEQYTYVNRLIGFGQYGLVVWGVVFCNVLSIQVLWFRRMRRNRSSCSSCRTSSWSACGWSAS